MSAHYKKEEVRNLGDVIKPKVHIGTIGHVDHGKHTLAEAIKMTTTQTTQPKIEEIRPVIICTDEDSEDASKRNNKKRNKLS